MNFIDLPDKYVLSEFISGRYTIQFKIEHSIMKYSNSPILTITVLDSYQSCMKFSIPNYKSIDIYAFMEDVSYCVLCLENSSISDTIVTQNEVYEYEFNYIYNTNMLNIILKKHCMLSGSNIINVDIYLGGYDEYNFVYLKALLKFNFIVCKGISASYIKKVFDGKCEDTENLYEKLQDCVSFI